MCKARMVLHWGLSINCGFRLRPDLFGRPRRTGRVSPDRADRRCARRCRDPRRTDARARLPRRRCPGSGRPRGKPARRPIATICALRSQSCVRPVPPSSFTRSDGLPESSSSASTCGATDTALKHGRLVDDVNHLNERNVGQFLSDLRVRAVRQFVDQLQRRGRAAAVLRDDLPWVLQARQQERRGGAADGGCDFGDQLLGNHARPAWHA